VFVCLCICVCACVCAYVYSSKYICVCVMCMRVCTYVVWWAASTATARFSCASWAGASNQINCKHSLQHSNQSNSSCAEALASVALQRTGGEHILQLPTAAASQMLNFGHQALTQTMQQPDCCCRWAQANPNQTKGTKHIHLAYHFGSIPSGRGPPQPCVHGAQCDRCDDQAALARTLS
jgi:hypothetical protein